MFVVKKNLGCIVNNMIIYMTLTIAALLCIIPLIHILALSFSSRSAAAAGWVSLLPIDFNMNSYKYLATKDEFWWSFVISIIRLVAGLPLNMLMCVLVAYPLSRENAQFRSRTKYVWYFAFTMFFSGGLIPGYILIKELNLLDTIWALVLPGAVPIFNCILLLNFFRNIPKELSESAFIDGADHITVLFKIYMPISLPSMATIFLFSFVGHWNSWLDGIIFMNNPKNYPLQSYLQIMINSVKFHMTNESVNPEIFLLMQTISDKTLTAAQIFLGAIPILAVYPLLQRHFVKGLVIGSVKG